MMVSITRKVNSLNDSAEIAPKKRFFKRIVFVDPLGMRYDRFGNYQENKQDYFNTLRMVFTGKCKDIFEAYKMRH